MTENFDLIVIGAGMAGIAAANKSSAKGWRVAIVDPLPYGGTCALRGCDPKKILRRGAEVIDDARLMRGKGVDDSSLSINWSDLMKHKSGFTDAVPRNMEKELTRNGVTTLHGAATFTAPDRVAIGGASYEARHFLLSTGARPRPLDLPGEEHLVDSTDFLNLDILPPRILFIGGGFVSFEFAHIAARAGAATVIVDRGGRPLKQFDHQLVELLIDRGTSAGIEVQRRTTVTGIEKSAAGFRVAIESGGAQSTIETDLVVHGAGRVPDLSGLNLESAGVAAGKRGVSVAGHLQSTTNPAVYAAGDSADTPGLPLTPVAVFEGKVAASNMLNARRTVPDYTAIPTAVFSIPELARVGMLEQQATDAGVDVEVRFSDSSGWYSNYRIGETVGATKILVDRSTDLIVGADMLGAGYVELVNLVALAMKVGITTRQLKSMTAAYPSIGSDLGSML